MRFRDAPAMIDWLDKAFGFTVHARYGEGVIIQHAELALGSAMIMLGSSRCDRFGEIVGEPGPNGRSIYIAVDDADAAFLRAEAAGAEIMEGLTDRGYGSREFICRDPEGNVWSLGTYWPKSSDRPN
jgi:uncharacterized glyoxalase superfamily protein PhnB